jgi:hypothetical protein
MVSLGWKRLITKYILCVIVREFENMVFSLPAAAERGIISALLSA